ncbi:MAG: hypothetical protein KTR24_15510 [Saprospiraceae bacterium]|nr:hypothetical protein [Saprospiraceae bacterium]
MKAKPVLFLIALFFASLAGAQEPVLGYWKGKMQSEYGKYEFKLTVQPQSDATVIHDGMKSTIKAVAMHNRLGLDEVIELNGVYFGDNSVYFSDVNNRFSECEGEGTFSRLQFLLKFEKGEAILDGHWQEYKDVKRYRKGRLRLKKSRGKA